MFSRQIRDGAWAITAATVWQASAMRSCGVERVIIANQVVTPGEIEWLARARDEDFDVYCYVDSLRASTSSSRHSTECGHRDRSRCSSSLGSAEDGPAFAALPRAWRWRRAVAASSDLALTGTAGFEGILGPVGDRDVGDVVGEFLDEIVELTHAIAAAGLVRAVAGGHRHRRW